MRWASFLLLLVAGSAEAGLYINGRMVTLSGQLTTPRVEALRPFYEWQADLPLCAFFTEKHVTEAYIGKKLPAEQLFEWYASVGVFDFVNLGVPEDRIGEILKVKGYALEHLVLNEAVLRAVVAKGYAVLVPVIPDFYWTPDDPMNDFKVDLEHRQGMSGVNHVVWLLDMTPDYVFLQDTALPNGASRAVRWDDFRRAWEPSGGRALVVAKVLPPLDPDRDGVPLTDADFDGSASVRTGGDDCDDARPDVHRRASEVPGNAIDEDCDGVAAPVDLLAVARASVAAGDYLVAIDTIRPLTSAAATTLRAEAADAWASSEREAAGSALVMARTMPVGPQQTAAFIAVRDRLVAVNERFPDNTLATEVLDNIARVNVEISHSKS